MNPIRNSTHILLILAFLVFAPSFGFGQLQVSAVSHNETCFGLQDGDAVFTITNGTAPYTFSWNNGPYTGQQEVLNADGNTQVYTNLPPGNYSITVVDANLNSQSLSIVIQGSSNPLFVQITNVTNISCAGTQGSGTASPSGGTGPYTYVWSPSAESNATATQLIAGNNDVTVTDAFGCVATANVSITNTGGLTIATSYTDITCNGSNDGTATITVSNQVPPVVYNWSDGQSTATATGFGPGTISCTVSDASGCPSAIFNFTFTEPPAMSVNIVVTDANCNGQSSGAAIVQVIGGSFPYSYQWGGGQTGNSITSQPAGPVNVIVTDASGCTLTDNDVINEPSVLTLSISGFVNDASCNGYADGGATLLANGGTPPYQCNWSPGTASGLVVNTLPAGIYNATLVDSKGCTAIQTIPINEPAPLVFSVASSVTAPICVGQSADLVVTPGTGMPPLTYTWDDGGTGSPYTVNPVVTTTYSVQASDGTCTSQAQSITVDVNLPLTISAISPLSACEFDTAWVEALAQGGDGNYTYTWDNNLGPGSGPFPFPVTAPATINVSVSDGCGTTPASTTIQVNMNPNPVALFELDTNMGCVPLPITFTDLSTISSGSITLLEWNFGEGSPSYDPNAFHVYENPGYYTPSLIATSNLGCKDTLSLDSFIHAFPIPIASFQPSYYNVNMLDPYVLFTNQSIDASIYTWLIDGDSITVENPDYTFQDTGVYYITLIASNEGGCVDQVTQKIAVEAFFAIYIPNTFTPHDPDGINDGFKPKGIGVREYEMKIYDRKGNRVFRTKNFDEAWMGTILDTGEEAEQGNYIYDIFLRDANGKQRFYAGGIKLIK
ncbi:MAG: gliding motility-associated C-terminal domain-containing protein [Bacteroidia bacterium]|nr:gliding motility-associated C-terminal domain-containing protein [Bacteroidia bacterium]